MYINQRPITYGTTKEFEDYYTSFNPPLPGELVYDNDRRRLVIGDGRTPYFKLLSINEKIIEDLINKSTVIISEDITSLSTEVANVESGFRREVSRIDSELSASASMYASMSNAKELSSWPYADADENEIYYTPHKTQYYYYTYGNMWNSIQSDSENMELISSWEESTKDISKLYYINSPNELVYYYYSLDSKDNKFKWLSTNNPQVLLTDDLTQIEDKSSLYYNSIPYIYYYYDDGWKSTYFPEEAGVKANIASVVAKVNESGDTEVAINADKINFLAQKFEIYPSDDDGNQISNTPNFSVDNKGNVTIKGDVKADSGYIGCWTLENNQLISPEAVDELDNSNKARLYIGNTSNTLDYNSSLIYLLDNNNNYLFRVTPTSIYANSFDTANASLNSNWLELHDPDEYEKYTEVTQHGITIYVPVKNSPASHYLSIFYLDGYFYMDIYDKSGSRINKL